MANEDKETKKIVDVAKPGESKPDATAKPVIVGHGAMLKEDPMVSGNKAADSIPGKDTEDKLTSKSEKVFNAPESVEVDESAKDEDMEKDSKDEAPAANPQESKDNAAQADSSDQAAVDAIAQQADKDKKKDAEPSDEEKARAEAIQKLIDDKKYYVSVSATRRQRKAVRTLIIMLILVFLAGVAVYLLIDANIIDLGIGLPVDFIQ